MDKVAEAQSYVDGLKVAEMQVQFMNHFRGTYFDPSLLAVGPMQSFLGLMVKQGYIKIL